MKEISVSNGLRVYLMADEGLGLTCTMLAHWACMALFADVVLLAAASAWEHRLVPLRDGRELHMAPGSTALSASWQCSRLYCPVECMLRVACAWARETLFQISQHLRVWVIAATLARTSRQHAPNLPS